MTSLSKPTHTCIVKFVPKLFAGEKCYLFAIARARRCLTFNQEMSNCYATGFALFYAKSGRMDKSSVVAFLPFFIND